MKRTADRTANDASALKPIGLTMAAVVAGLGVSGRAQAADVRVGEPLAPTPNTRVQYVDPTSDPASEEIVLGPSEPVQPLAAKPEKQADLFDPNVPLGRIK